MRPLTAAAVLAAAAAAAITLIAAVGVRAREAALARAAGPTDDACQCRICARLRGSGLVTRAIAETRAQDAAAQRLRTLAALRAVSPDGEW